MDIKYRLDVTFEVYCRYLIGVGPEVKMRQIVVDFVESVDGVPVDKLDGETILRAGSQVVSFLASLKTTSAPDSGPDTGDDGDNSET